MRYENNICDGCKKKFSETDDIVVCPVCGTPQHRECYEKNGECVNAALHESGFSWHGEVTTPLSKENEKKQLRAKSLFAPRAEALIRQSQTSAPSAARSSPFSA